MVDLSLVKPEHLWYIVGLIVTDGNLSISGRHINITSKDRDLLYAVRKSLFIDNKIGRKSSGSNREKIYSVLQVGDKKFYNYLMSVGLTTKKSLTLKEIKVPDEYFVDFVRGVIDGDGNIQTWVHRTNGNKQWSLRIVSGASIFSRWLKEGIERKFSVKGKIHPTLSKNKKNPLYVIKFGKFPAKVILSGCYYSGCLALGRKLKKAIKCIKSENGLTRYGKVVSNWARVAERQTRWV